MMARWDFENVIHSRRGDTSHKGSCCHWMDTVVQGAWEQASQSAIDLCGLGGPCLWVHLPQLTDYYRLCWDLGIEKTPSTITLYGRDISNKTPISSERENEEREGKKGFWKAFGNGRQSHFILPLLVFFLLHSSTLIFL